VNAIWADMTLPRHPEGQVFLEDFVPSCLDQMVSVIATFRRVCQSHVPGHACDLFPSLDPYLELEICHAPDHGAATEVDRICGPGL